MLLLLALAASTAWADEALEQLFGRNPSFLYSAIGAGYGQQMSKAPGVVTVITSEDIEKMGVTSLEQVLAAIPGLHVSTVRGFRTIYSTRGIWSENNSDFLIKIDDVPVRDPILGGRPIAFTMPLRNISRIEIVKGPGSIIHGSDAISGIVNIITKTGRELITDPFTARGGKIVGYAGSFDTYGGAFLYGAQKESVEYAISIQGETTDGSDKNITRDAQTFIDESFGFRASRAPGRINQDRRQIHVHGDVRFGNFTVRTSYRGIENVGTGVGSFNALDPNGFIDNRLFNVDLEHVADHGGGVSTKTVVTYRFTNLELLFDHLPPSPLFPAGLQERFDVINHQVLFKSVLLTRQITSHSIQIGIGGEADFQSKVEHRRNFIRAPTPLRVASLTSLSKVKNDPVKKRRRRYHLYGLVEDGWDFAPDWRLDAGLRMDGYSDESTVLSPRVALIRNLSPYLTGKFLYNRSFHMPSFFEQIYGKNPNPELIDMLEATLEYRLPGEMEWLVSLFGYRLDDLIVESPAAIGFAAFRNIDLKGYGAEISARKWFADTLETRIGYTFQRAIERRTNRVYGMAPNHLLFSEVNWKFLPRWNLNLQLKWVGKRKRAPGDPRDALDPYALLSCNIRTKVAKSIHLNFSARNLLDADAREPSNTFLLPDDIPLPGRSLYGIVEVEF